MRATNPTGVRPISMRPVSSLKETVSQSGLTFEAFGKLTVTA